MCDLYAAREYHNDFIAVCDIFAERMGGKQESVLIQLREGGKKPFKTTERSFAL